MTQLTINLPDRVFQILQREAQQRGESTDTLIIHYLSIIKTILMDKPVVSNWPMDFFENTAGSWQGEALERSFQGDFEERLEL